VQPLATPSRSTGHEVVVVPEIRIRQLVRRGGASVVEGSLMPYLLLAGALQLAGFRTAVVAALAATLAVAAYRWRARGRVSGILVLSLLTLAVRTGFAVVTGDANVYFLQPVVATVLVAGAFAATACLGRPLAWRLAGDFVVLPEQALEHPHVGAFFRRLSFLWAAVHMTKALLTVWLLWTVPLDQFVLLKGLLSLVLMGGAIGGSVVWFRRAVVTGPLGAAPVAVTG
jgi:intracellular septation protein A